MKRVLLTGGSGFVGGNILPLLRRKYIVDAPGRKELDVRDAEQVKQYVTDGHYDVVIHLASPSPVRSKLDSYDKLFEDCLKIFMNFYSVRSEYGRMIYSGSGAEFDKRQHLCMVTEEHIGNSIPVDDYGRAKYIMNELARGSENIYNFRIFGCYGPNEYDSKFIRHVIRCCMEERPITIRQDCYFDYMFVEDYAEIVEYGIEHELRFHDYNVVSGQRIKLSEIAQLVSMKMNHKKGIEIAYPGMNNEYTASNVRLLSEMNYNMKFTEIEKGIERMIRWEETINEEKSS